MNDNALRQTYLLLAVQTASQEKQAGAMALFALPFLLFSPLAGQVADRFSKRTVIVCTKTIEILVMVLAGWAMWQQNLLLLLFSILLMTSQSCFFSPAKYGILPELLDYEQLSAGNGIIQMTTNVAIMVGIALAGLLLQVTDAFWIGLVLLSFSVLGWLVSLFIEPVEPADRELEFGLEPFQRVASSLSWILEDTVLFQSMLAFSYVWFVGTFLTLVLNVYGLQVLELGEAWTSLLFVFLASGIGLGSILAGRWSGEIIEFGLIPLGASGMAVTLLVLSRVESSWLAAYGWLLISGLFSGFFLIPLQATLQERPAPEKKGELLATTNIFSFTAVISAAAAYVLLTGPAGLSSQALFLLLGLTTFGVGGWLIVYLPRIFVRFVLWLLVNTVYRINIRQRENIPREGPALLVANHVSYVDALLIQATMPRLIRFIGFGPLLKIPLLGHMLKLMKVIPVTPGRPGQIKEALATAEQALEAGEIVCLFPEGAISRTGQLNRFRRGVERLGNRTEAPVIPVHLDQVWGSIFSYESGRFFWKLPRRLPYPVTVSFGPAIEPEITAQKVREAIQVQGAAATDERVRREPSLPAKFIRTARGNPFSRGVVDSTARDLTYGKLLVGVLAMRGQLNQLLGPDEQNVGVLLPPSAGGALVNLALSLDGRTAVNLNQTTGRENVNSACEQAELNRVITSRRYLDKLDVELPVEVNYLGELTPSTGAKLRAGLAALLPTSLIMKFWGGVESNDQLAAIIFSSGTTGRPKGVKLSHATILANIEGLQQVFSMKKGDRMLAVMPFFHSFGYTGGLWLPLIMGLGVIYHYDPLDARKIGELMDNYNGSIIIGTPTFYRLYHRVCSSEQFSKLRIAITGAEKLKPALSEKFERKFGVPLLEGYGCTEMAPVVTVNIPDVEHESGVNQQGNKPNSAGRPLPGVALRIVDPETHDRLDVDESGLILARGANRMEGYLNQPELTENTFLDGWYMTGDIGHLDADGFLFVTDRLARFSKIGGEMVPHIKVENQLEKLVEARDLEVELVVTGVRAEQRGEKLVVLWAGQELPLEALDEALRETALPELWVPEPANFYEVESIPRLGTGKLDLQSIKEVARKKAGTPET